MLEDNSPARPVVPVQHLSTVRAAPPLGHRVFLTALVPVRTRSKRFADLARAEPPLAVHLRGGRPDHHPRLRGGSPGDGHQAQHHPLGRVGGLQALRLQLADRECTWVSAARDHERDEPDAALRTLRIPNPGRCMRRRHFDPPRTR